MAPRDVHAGAGLAPHRIKDDRRPSVRMYAEKDVGKDQGRVRRGTRILRRHPSQQLTRRGLVKARHLTPSPSRNERDPRCEWCGGTTDAARRSRLIFQQKTRRRRRKWKSAKVENWKNQAGRGGRRMTAARTPAAGCCVEPQLPLVAADPSDSPRRTFPLFHFSSFPLGDARRVCPGGDTNISSRPDNLSVKCGRFSHASGPRRRT